MYEELKIIWSKKADSIIATANAAVTPEKRLSIKGRALRTIRTLAARAAVMDGILEKDALEDMESQGVEEHSATRLTFMYIVRTFAITKNAGAESVYRKVVMDLGIDLAQRLYQRKEWVVPEKRFPVYILNEEELAKLTDAQKRKLSKATGLPVKVMVNETPQRVKMRLPRRKRATTT